MDNLNVIDIHYKFRIGEIREDIIDINVEQCAQMRTLGETSRYKKNFERYIPIVTT